MMGPLTADEINAMVELLPIIKAESSASGVDWVIVAAIMRRESRFGLILDEDLTGDHGHGRGLMQVDDRAHPWVRESDDWKDPALNIRYAINNVLKPYMRMYQGDLQSALAAYNAGGAAVDKKFESGEDPDMATTGHDYGADVMNSMDLIRAWDNPQEFSL